MSTNRGSTLSFSPDLEPCILTLDLLWCGVTLLELEWTQGRTRVWSHDLSVPGSAPPEPQKLVEAKIEQKEACRSVARDKL